MSLSPLTYSSSGSVHVSLYRGRAILSLASHTYQPDIEQRAGFRSTLHRVEDIISIQNMHEVCKVSLASLRFKEVWVDL
jgi:hypothetical protein